MVRLFKTSIPRFSALPAQPRKEILYTSALVVAHPTEPDLPTLLIGQIPSRPAAGLLGSTVEIWGCGGLGSWIAELVVRANPKKVVLRDTGLVHRGHLVRQNYTELDVGGPKGENSLKDSKQ